MSKWIRYRERLPEKNQAVKVMVPYDSISLVGEVKNEYLIEIDAMWIPDEDFIINQDDDYKE